MELFNFESAVSMRAIFEWSRIGEVDCDSSTSRGNTDSGFTDLVSGRKTEQLNSDLKINIPTFVPEMYYLRVGSHGYLTILDHRNDLNL